MNCEGCVKKCPELRPLHKEDLPPADLTPKPYTYSAWDDLPIDKRTKWELASPSGRHTVYLADTYPQANRFKEGIDNCPGPKVKKVWKFTVSRKCQNPALSK